MDEPNPIRRLRKAKGLSQDKLAAAVGHQKAAISKLEKGQRTLTLEWARKLAPVLGCSIADLLPDLGAEAAAHEETPLRQIRRDRGLSQEELARQARATPKEIEDLETRRRHMTKEWALRLAAPLECHWSELLAFPAVQTPKEEAMLNLFRGLSEEEQNSFLKFADTVAKSHQPPSDDGDSDNGDNGHQAGGAA